MFFDFSKAAVLAGSLMFVYGGVVASVRPRRGVSYNPNELTNELWRLDLDQQEWTQLATPGTQARKKNEAATCCQLDRPRGLFNSLFFFLLLVFVDPLVPAVAGHTAVLVNDLATMLVLGGRMVGTPYLLDVLEFDLASNSWSRHRPTGPLPYVAEHSAVYSPGTNLVFIFGGFQAQWAGYR